MTLRFWAKSVLGIHNLSVNPSLELHLQRAKENEQVANIETELLSLQEKIAELLPPHSVLSRPVRPSSE